MPEQTASRLRTKDLTLIALFTVLTAVCAWISVPVPAPLIQFTMQTFAVFAALLTLEEGGEPTPSPPICCLEQWERRCSAISGAGSAYCWGPPAATFWDSSSRRCFTG